ncbi:coat protein [Citrus virus B]|nr:coat protein [Citrus virus B]
MADKKSKSLSLISSGGTVAKAKALKIVPVIAGVTSEDEDNTVVTCIKDYAKVICESETDDAQAAVMMAFIQSAISHTTSPEAQKDPDLVVHFEFGGKPRVYSKKDFNDALKSKVANKNLERRYTRKHSVAINDLMSNKIVEAPMTAASKHGALQGYENTAADFLRLAPGQQADDARASSLLISRQATGGKGKSTTKFVNVSQIIDAAKSGN